MVQRNSNPAALNPARRFTVRLALATGATVATLMGSQTLAILEVSQNAAPTSESAVSAISPNTGSNPAKPAVPTQPPAPPQLVIIRQAGAGGSADAPKVADHDADDPGKTAIMPPQPVVIKPPAPNIIVQPPDTSAPVQPAPSQPMPVTRSSR